MYPSYRLMHEVKRAAGGKFRTEGLECSLALIEASTPAGPLMSTLAVDPFRPTMVDVAKGCPESEVLAWMTLAAAGAGKVRRIVAKRALQIVPPHELVDVLVAGGDLRPACELRAEQSSSEEEWGAWQLLSRVPAREIRRLVERRALLRRRYEAARREARRPINPQVAGQLQALGLV